MAIEASDHHSTHQEANGGPSSPTSPFHEPWTQSPSSGHSENNNSNNQQNDRTFAELCDNPPPELAIDPDCLPEAVVADDAHAHTTANASENENENQPKEEEDGDNDHASTRPAIQPDSRDSRGPAIVYAEPDRSWIAKHKTWVITGLIVAVIIMIGITVGVVEVEKARNAVGSGGATSTSAVSSSSTSAIAGSSSSSTGGATSTSSSTGTASSTTPSACTDTSMFRTKVSWMGIADAMGGWSVSYASTTDATSCCAYCYQSTSAGCDAWAWIPDDASGSTITACNIISGWNGTDSDDTCPSGYTLVQFVQTGSNVSHVGAPGPCASAS